MKSTKRRDIMDATIALVCEQGVQASSMSRIASRAGVGMGTIYNYFEGKEDLLAAIYVEHGHRLHRAIFSSFPETATFEQRFKHVWRSMIDHFGAHPDEFHFAERVRNSGLLPPEVVGERLKLWASLDVLFEDARTQDVVGDIHLGVFLGMLHGAIGAYIASGQQDPTTLEYVLDGFWRSLTSGL